MSQQVQTDDSGPLADVAPSSYIAGQWRESSGQLIESKDPHSGLAVQTFRATSSTDLAWAVEAASEAAPGWGAAPVADRARLLLDLADRIDADAAPLADLVVQEVGKPVREAREEVHRSAALVRYQSGAALDPAGEVIPDSDGTTALLYTRTQPLGTIGLITPWNFPLAIPLWKLAPALAYGNTVVLKGSPDANAIATRLAELFSAFPVGVFNLVSGGSDQGRQLAQSGLHGLSFTGSTAAGRDVAHEALLRNTRYQAELGGKNASIVLPGADLQRAAEIIAIAAFGYAGQKCTATSRVIVPDLILEPFIERLLGVVGALRVGDPRDSLTDVGPLITNLAVARVDGFVARAVVDGAEVLAGGETLPRHGPNYYAPTVLRGVHRDSEIAQTEVFGPVLAIISARNPEHALEIANDTQYGLAAAVFTTELQSALNFAHRLSAGLIRVNGPTPGVMFNAPFGPAGISGIGLPEQGKDAREFYTRKRTISIA